ncbi:MAG: hypothetical protein J7M14_08370 [Planctomycetes bacterium]|nr:hypothetical protein [Planctomycetota bacterium]
MADAKGRFDWVADTAKIGLIVVIAILAIMLISTISNIVARPPHANLREIAALAGEILSQVAVLLIAFVVYGVVSIAASAERSAAVAAGRLGRIEAMLSRQEVSTGKLVEFSSLSDRAKSLVFRQRELRAVREAVHHDAMRKDYKTAEALIDRLEDQLGYYDEAARLREELEAIRQGSHEDKIDRAVKRIEDIVKEGDWLGAIREYEGLRKIFPADRKVASLGKYIEQSRNRRKRELLRAYRDAVGKKDIDLSISLLKELDAHLTSQEAAALEESARGVFKAKLLNLGVQFSISVTDNNWGAAVAAGEEIVRDYPNTRMAHEVSDKMEILRIRAAAENNPAD